MLEVFRMSSFSIFRPFADQYSSRIMPAIEEVRVSSLPYIKKMDDMVEAVRADYCVIQDTCSDFVERSFGETASLVVSTALRVFPEIVACVTAISGHTVLPLAIFAARIISDFSWAAVSLVNKEMLPAGLKAQVACSDIGKRVVQGAVLTSFIAGGAFLLKGLMSHSFSTCMRGFVFLATAFSAKNVVMNVPTGVYSHAKA